MSAWKDATALDRGRFPNPLRAEPPMCVVPGCLTEAARNATVKGRVYWFPWCERHRSIIGRGEGSPAAARRGRFPRSGEL